jgi:hypothetical protein
MSLSWARRTRPRTVPARPGAARGLAGGPGRRRDLRAGQGGRRGAGGRTTTRSRTTSRSTPGTPTPTARRLARRTGRGGEGRRGGRTRRVRRGRRRASTPPRRSTTADGAPRRDGPWEAGRLEVVDSNQGTTWVAGELANLFSLDPAAGAGAVRTRRRRLRIQGGTAAPGGRRDGRDRSPAPGPRGVDAPSDVLPGRLPQPHHPAVRLGADPTDGCAPSTTRHSASPRPCTSSSNRAPRSDARCTTPTPTAPPTGSYGSTCRPPPSCAPRGRRRAPSHWSPRSTNSPRSAASTRSPCASATNPRWDPSPDSRSAAAT